MNDAPPVIYQRSRKEHPAITSEMVAEAFEATKSDRIVKLSRGFSWGYAWWCAGYSKYRPGFIRRLGRTLMMFFGLAYAFRRVDVGQEQSRLRRQSVRIDKRP